jgi:hypothetical protein
MMKPTDTDHDPYDGLPPLSPDEEATMQEEIELALEPYRRIAPPSLIPILRDELEHALRTHPYPRQLVKAFATRKPVVVSGEGAIDGSEESEAKAGGREGA